MQSFNHLMTTRPHEVRQVLISDLHLSPQEPALVQAFLALLDDCLALPALKRLYILGDWFEVWLGDDMYLSLLKEKRSEAERQAHWLTPLIVKLKKLRVAGCEILVMHGNRDFLLGQPFCNLFGGELIYEPYNLMVGQQNYRLEHGDALCTDDKKYQFFRRIMRNPLTQWYLLNKPLEKRLAIANKMRQKSQQNNASKAAHIMDVNDVAVRQAITASDALLHGHTHRPDIHQATTDKKRYVLGDWRLLDKNKRQPKVSAVIGAVTENDDDAEFSLVEFTCNMI
ncbi:UDP-2,3-diacylglucosamine diphosphatase [Psychrobacter aquaticus]|uniref:UDP-2,3-diacylglucosamine hydrolase n=1 Tax=Psychrobacter aquaticus CMS 56 TaxID=1354303 RepID=U4T5W4_9GAMM|nr:UDP-2,3-diacylglucosamine diphosphatase [Psychrobacter aquaticus]ERL56305.1 UDP-2,3-diacylglucosamine hydrolase [Psychrobacter aquaticus CMS 56]